MQMQDFNKEFVLRTKAIIENKEIEKATEYEVTLLLNCLVGLIVVATESTKAKANADLIDKKFMSDCVQELRRMKVIVKFEDDEKIFRTLKNAVSHVYIEPDNINNEIKHVIFRDKYSRNEKEFHTELKFTVEQLRAYALFVADLHLARRNNLLHKNKI